LPDFEELVFFFWELFFSFVIFEDDLFDFEFEVM
jgi:hypothetical protein